MKLRIIMITLALIAAALLLINQASSQEEYVAEVTAAVKLDCTVETHMYTEDCIKRLTDDIAEARALKEKTRALLETAIENDNEADDLLDSALENYNTVYGG